MPTPAASLVLRTAASDELVLTADFAATGRTTATFHDLVERLATEVNIWETAPAPYGTEQGMTGHDQVDRWARDLKDSGLRVRAVIGFCGGGVYAAALAERASRWQAEPRLVLLDPGVVKPYMQVEHVQGWLTRLTPAFAEEDAGHARRALLDIATTSPGPLELARRLGGYVREVLQPALGRTGHSGQAASDLADLVIGYLHWLAGAAQLDPRPRWREAPALNSATPGFGLHLLPAADRAGLVRAVTFYDVPHSDLMRHDQVARAVDALLARPVDAPVPVPRRVL
ncbi:MAG: hypothetical protein HY241_12480 [Actinobacteria bacterium]|nr:hypothetical protein [Actinomycetota bacterium]